MTPRARKVKLDNPQPVSSHHTAQHRHLHGIGSCIGLCPRSPPHPATHRPAHRIPPLSLTWRCRSSRQCSPAAQPTVFRRRLEHVRAVLGTYERHSPPCSCSSPDTALSATSRWQSVAISGTAHRVRPHRRAHHGATPGARTPPARRVPAEELPQASSSFLALPQAASSLPPLASSTASRFLALPRASSRLLPLPLPHQAMKASG